LLPREYGVLYALSTAADGLRIKELGNDVLLSQPGMSRLIARLEVRGLVERADDPHDARACRIRLTPAGIDAQPQVDAAHGRHIAAAMTLLAATVGGSLHALVVDEQLRPLFAHLHALTLSTSVFAAPEDWATSALGSVIERAATELAVILDAGADTGSPIAPGRAISTRSPAEPPARHGPQPTSTSTPHS
jgi:DNA-binding MarR family transcriptional regulator